MMSRIFGEPKANNQKEVQKKLDSTLQEFQNNPENVKINEFIVFVVNSGLNIHDLHQWAYRYLVALEKQKHEKSGAPIDNRPTYDMIAIEIDLFDFKNYLVKLFEHAKHKGNEAFKLLLSTFGKAQVNTGTSYNDWLKKIRFADDSSLAKKTLGYYEKGNQMELFKCKFCGSVMQMKVASGQTPILTGGCFTCGARMEFEHVVRSDGESLKKENPNQNMVDSIMTQINHINFSQLNKLQAENIVTDLFEQLIKFNGYQKLDMELWFARVYIYLTKNNIIIRKLSKLPSDMISENYHKSPAMIMNHIITDVLGGLDPKEKVAILLETINPKNKRWHNQAGFDTRSNTIRGMYCNKCQDCFPHNEMGNPYDQVIEDRKNKKWFAIEKIICESCGSNDVGYFYEPEKPNPNKLQLSSEQETLASGNPKNRDQMLAKIVGTYLFEHFTNFELDLLIRTIKGYNFNLEQISGTVISLRINDIVRYFLNHRELDLLITGIKKYTEISPLYGELRNIKCLYCGAIQTLPLNKDGHISSRCSSCGGEGGQAVDSLNTMVYPEPEFISRANPQQINTTEQQQPASRKTELDARIEQLNISESMPALGFAMRKYKLEDLKKAFKTGEFSDVISDYGNENQLMLILHLIYKARMIGEEELGGIEAGLKLLVTYLTKINTPSFYDLYNQGLKLSKQYIELDADSLSELETKWLYAFTIPKGIGAAIKKSKRYIDSFHYERIKTNPNFGFAVSSLKS